MISKYQKRFLEKLFFTILLSLIIFSSSSYADAPYETKRISNLVYKTVGDQEIKLSLFLPTENGEILPCRPTLLWIDSGCWFSAGPGGGGIWRDMKLVEKGFAVASIAHQSLENVTFPNQIEDVRAAVRFLRANAETYGLDPKRFAVSGCSSGGNLSLYLGIPDGAVPFDVGDNLDQSSQVQGVVDFYGPVCFSSYLQEYGIPRLDCLYRVIGADIEKPIEDQVDSLLEPARLYSPLTYVSEHFAPTLIFQGALDVTVPLSQSAALYEALRRAGVRTRLWVGNQGVHEMSSLFPPEEGSAHIIDFLKEIGFEDEKTML